MDDVELDKQNSNVVILCEKYLQEDSGAMMLLNKIINLVADFALIDERTALVDDTDEFDYAEELQELVFALKMLEHDLETNNLLLLGDYAEHVSSNQDKHAD